MTHEPRTRTIRTLGPPELTRAGTPLGVLVARPTRLAILVYVAIEREVSREVLASVFWPDRSPRMARRNLSQALYEIRESVGDQWMNANGESVALSSDVQVDAETFFTAIADGDHDLALELYSAPFLNGFELRGYGEFERWADRTRTRLHGLARQSFRSAIAIARARGNGDNVVSLSRRWSTIDPLDDEAAHELILALVRTGARADALRYYDLFESALREQLEVEPLEKTREIVRLARARPSGQLRPASSGEADAGAGVRYPELGPLPGLMS